MKKILNLFLLTCLFVSLSASMALAAGTTAGTDITNTATVNYTVDTIPLTQDSPTVTFTVAEILDATLVWRDASNVIVKPNDTGAPTMLTFELVNTGNYDEIFDLIVDNTDATDNFDPAAPTIIYFDANDDDTFVLADDTEYDGTNFPALGEDESIHLFVFNVIPGTPVDTDLGISNLTATAQTKITEGAAADPTGTAYAGAGFDGTVVAVVGTSTATVDADGTYQVSRVDVTIDKTGDVTDDGLGGTEPVPGATIEYTITINVQGGTAAGLVITDPIPADTTYVPGSMALEGINPVVASASLTDAAGDDEGELVDLGAGNFEISVDLSDVIGGAAPGTGYDITFEVTID